MNDSISRHKAALNLALSSNDVELMKQAFEGYPLNTPLEDLLNTLPIRIAILYQAWDAVDFLVERGESLEKHIVDELAGQNALFYALGKKMYPPIELVKKMALCLENINELNMAGENALMVLLKKNEPDDYPPQALIELIELGADVDVDVFYTTRSVLNQDNFKENYAEVLAYFEYKNLEKTTTIQPNGSNRWIKRI